jgi:hypothetical protein
VNAKQRLIASFVLSLVVCPLALFGVLFEASYFYVRIVGAALLVVGVPWLLSLLIMMAVSRARGQTDWFAKQLVTLAWTAQLALYLLLSIRIGDLLAEREVQVLRSYLETEAKAVQDGRNLFADGFAPLADYRSLCRKYAVEWRQKGQQIGTFRYHDPRLAIARHELIREGNRWLQAD